MSYRCISVGGGLVQVQLFLLRHGHAHLARRVAGALCVWVPVSVWMAAGAAPQDSLQKALNEKAQTSHVYQIRRAAACRGIAARAGGQRCGDGRPVLLQVHLSQGVLEGAIPLAAVNAGIRSALGQLFTWKLFVLIAVVVLSVLFYRPFCKWICPLGAFYALMNKVSLLGIRVDACKCVSCGTCSKVCQMDVDVVRAPNHAECIRCGKCIGACPVDAISYRYGLDVSEEKLPLTADKK